MLDYAVNGVIVLVMKRKRWSCGDLLNVGFVLNEYLIPVLRQVFPKTLQNPTPYNIVPYHVVTIDNTDSGAATVHRQDELVISMIIYTDVGLNLLRWRWQSNRDGLYGCRPARIRSCDD